MAKQNFDRRGYSQLILDLLFDHNFSLCHRYEVIVLEKARRTPMTLVRERKVFENVHESEWVREREREREKVETGKGRCNEFSTPAVYQKNRCCCCFCSVPTTKNVCKQNLKFWFPKSRKVFAAARRWRTCCKRYSGRRPARSTRTSRPRRPKPTVRGDDFLPPVRRFGCHWSVIWAKTKTLGLIDGKSTTIIKAQSNACKLSVWSDKAKCNNSLANGLTQTVIITYATYYTKFHNTHLLHISQNAIDSNFFIQNANKHHPSMQNDN